MEDIFGPSLCVSDNKNMSSPNFYSSKTAQSASGFSIGGEWSPPKSSISELAGEQKKIFCRIEIAHLLQQNGRPSVGPLNRPFPFLPPPSTHLLPILAPLPFPRLPHFLLPSISPTALLNIPSVPPQPMSSAPIPAIWFC